MPGLTLVVRLAASSSMLGGLGGDGVEVDDAVLASSRRTSSCSRGVTGTLSSTRVMARLVTARRCSPPMSRPSMLSRYLAGTRSRKLTTVARASSLNSG
jgi:hypothetical protein